ncbi:hypothetical protein VSDG_05801 [Cytospora chrysosperma]|uniref:Uncharacterized protein n=1 Tax=Cytospora chrysosperma TaxID=252740 RepID=A0A423VVX4_CYTCH|nr:hypothetical protein VSDG_05801 [Valsa sordida]
MSSDRTFFMLMVTTVSPSAGAGARALPSVDDAMLAQESAGACMLSVAGPCCSRVRLTTMGICGLWYLSRGRWSRQKFREP